MTMLVQLIYTSSYEGSIGLEQARDIARKAGVANEQNGVTGLLMFGHGHFLQVLEGSTDAVNETYQRIAKDPRHRRLRLLSYREVGARDFAAWHMQHVDASSIGAVHLQRHGLVEHFEPSRLRASQALGLLRFAARSIEIKTASSTVNAA